MEICLYHPDWGYYTAGPPPVGPQGDFVTYPAAHPAFGRLLARQIVECWEAMGQPNPFTLVEMGGGRGTLTVDLLQGIRRDCPALQEALDLLLVDASPVLLEHQTRALAGFARVRTMAPAPFFSRGRVETGVILSNEVVDALPVHVVEQRDGALHEVHVWVGQDRIDERLPPPGDPRIAAYLRRLNAQLVDGQRTEVGLAAADWMRGVGRVLHRGLVITLDFGYTAPEYFHPWRTRGTVMAYRQHRASDDVYALPGGQDLCAHVNFSALIQAGQEMGLAPMGLIPQDRFLFRMGLIDEMADLEARRSHMEAGAFWREKLSLRRLMMPQSPQGGFQVLLQHKGWDPPSLRGLSDPRAPTT
jgi:SAM-dependent MidA family methyltransferase